MVGRPDFLGLNNSKKSRLISVVIKGLVGDLGEDRVQDGVFKRRHDYACRHD